MIKFDGVLRAYEFQKKIINNRQKLQVIIQNILLIGKITEVHRFECEADNRAHVMSNAGQ